MSNVGSYFSIVRNNAADVTFDVNRRRGTRAPSTIKSDVLPQHLTGEVIARKRGREPRRKTHRRGAPTAQVPCSRAWRYARVVLRNALNTGLRWRLVSRNAATLVDAPRAVVKDIQPLTANQAKHLLTTAKGNPLEAFVSVALSCGLWRGEILGLKWADVNLEATTVYVRGAVQRFGGDPTARRPLLAERKRLMTAVQLAQSENLPDEERTRMAQELGRVRAALHAIKTSLQVVELKSTRSRRTIALPAVAVAALRTHRVRQLEARLSAGPAWKDQGFVFTSGIGTPLEPRKVTREFKALLKDADLPAIRFHDLRHSCATLLLAQGVSPRVVMETLGHSQISLTLNTYSHVLPALQRDAATKMDGILSGS